MACLCSVTPCVMVKKVGPVLVVVVKVSSSVEGLTTKLFYGLVAKNYQSSISMKFFPGLKKSGGKEKTKI